MVVDGSAVDDMDKLKSWTTGNDVSFILVSSTCPTLTTLVGVEGGEDR